MGGCKNRRRRLIKWCCSIAIFDPLPVPGRVVSLKESCATLDLPSSPYSHAEPCFFQTWFAPRKASIYYNAAKPLGVVILCESGDGDDCDDGLTLTGVIPKPADAKVWILQPSIQDGSTDFLKVVRTIRSSPRSREVFCKTCDVGASFVWVSGAL